jgi:hypothetical protein
VTAALKGAAPPRQSSSCNCHIKPNDVAGIGNTGWGGVRVPGAGPQVEFFFGSRCPFATGDTREATASSRAGPVLISAIRAGSAFGRKNDGSNFRWMDRVRRNHTFLQNSRGKEPVARVFSCSRRVSILDAPCGDGRAGMARCFLVASVEMMPSDEVKKGDFLQLTARSSGRHFELVRF